MLGYLKDKRDYFKGNLVNFYLKQGVAFSGGSQQHLEYFKGLLNYSIYNNTTGRYLHDTKAGQFTLHLFPLKTRILLALVFYKYEINLLNKFNEYKLTANNILLPSNQISFNSIITEESISAELLNLLDEVALNNQSLNNLLKYLNIQDYNFTLKDNLIENITNILNIFSLSNNTLSNYLNIVNNNDRYLALNLSADALNYKTQSKHYLTEALTKWHQTSNI